MGAISKRSPTIGSAARRSAAAGRNLSRWWGKSPARALGVIAAAGAIVSATVVATVMTAGTELAGSARADFGTATASPSAKVSGVADQTSASHYLDNLNDVDKQFEANLQTLGTAVQNADWDGAKAACQQVADSGQAFKDTLPSPDSRVTPRVKQAADYLNTAFGICSGFGPASVQGDWDQFMASVNNARADLVSAASILQHPR